MRVVYYSSLIKFVFGPDTVRDSRERVPVPLDPPTRAGARNAQAHTSKALFTQQRDNTRGCCVLRWGDAGGRRNCHDLEWLAFRAAFQRRT